MKTLTNWLLHRCIPQVSSGVILISLLFPYNFIAHADPQIPQSLSGWRKNSTCIATIFHPQRLPNRAQISYHFSELHNYTHGLGQKIAILSTGVAHNPRLTHLKNIGDYIGHRSQLEDCDGIGTAVAGIIGAIPVDHDHFFGIAPDALILSARIESHAYTLSRKNISMSTSAQNHLNMMARGIWDAATNGAQTILIPQALCFAPTLAVNTQPLLDTISYVVHHYQTVIISASGDSFSSGCTGASSATQVLVAPKLSSPLILSVGSLSENGRPSPFSLPTTLPAVASIGENIVSLSNTNGTYHNLANGSYQPDNSINFFNSTAYAAAYVAGLAVLIHASNPQLTAHQIISRITTTAHTFSALNSQVGYGSVDPQAALSWNIDYTNTPAFRQKASYTPPKPGPAIASHIIIVCICLAVIIVSGFISVIIRIYRSNTRLVVSHRPPQKYPLPHQPPAKILP